MNVTNPMYYSSCLKVFSNYFAGVDLLISNNMISGTLFKGRGQLKKPYFEKE